MYIYGSLFIALRKLNKSLSSKLIFRLFPSSKHFRAGPFQSNRVTLSSSKLNTLPIYFTSARPKIVMAGLDSVTELAIAELVIYLAILPIVFFLLVRHGKRGVFGWIYLIAFCILRIVASGLQINDHVQESHGKPPSVTAAIVNSVGISPLLLAIAGVMHEG
jgi:prolipoprotein diacylglyceryltransferase